MYNYIFLYKKAWDLDLYKHIPSSILVLVYLGIPQCMIPAGMIRYRAQSIDSSCNCKLHACNTSIHIYYTSSS